MSELPKAKLTLKREQTAILTQDDCETPMSDDEDCKQPEDPREVWVLCDDDELIAKVYDYLERNKVPKNYIGPLWIDDDVFILDVPMTQ